MGIHYPNKRGVYYKDAKTLLDQVNIEEVRELEVESARFPLELLQLSQLRVLSLYNIQAFPSEIVAFEHLEELHVLGNNPFTSAIPLFRLALPQLKRLWMSTEYYNGLEPQGLAGLSSLEYLNLDKIYVANFPEKVLALKQLKHLHLNSCKCHQLPDEIAQFSQLEVLNVNNNGLSKLPEALGELTQLKSLYIKGNKLKILPSYISQLTQLQSIDAGYNRLKELPETLDNLENLEHLVLSKNQLTHLPNSLTNCRKLTLLNVEENKLTELPKDIGKLTQLETLQLYKNQLQNLPESLEKLKALSTFDIDNNPIDWQTLPYQNDGFRELMLRFVYEKISLRAIAALSDQLQYFPPALATHPLQAGAVISITGRTGFKIKELKPALEQQGMRYQKKLDEHITHLVVGRLPKLTIEEVLKHKITFISEAQLNQYLQEQAPPDPTKYLLQQDEHTPEAVNNLKDLLLSEDSSNVALAVELIKSGGFPTELHTELFMAYKMVDDLAVRKQIKPLLEKHSSEKAKEAIRQRMSLFSEHIGEMRLRRNINKYTKDNELDGVKIAHYFWQRYRKGILYIFSYGNSEQIKEVLPEGDILDLSGLKINALPDELAQCSQLKHVLLKDCQFAVFPKVLLQLPQLETLNLALNQIGRLPDELPQLTKLKKLDLSYNFFQSFPELLYQLPQLEYISLKTWHIPAVTPDVLKEVVNKLPNCEIEW